MQKKISIICFIAFIYFMFLGNTYCYFRGEDSDRIQTESENTSTYLDAMSQTKIGKYFFINLNGEILKLFGKRVVCDSSGKIFKLDNGYLCAESIYKDTTMTTATLNETYLALKEKGIGTLFVSARGVVSKSGAELPIGVTEYDNSVTDSFLQQLQAQDIPFLDSYDVLSRNNYRWEENYFKTDHHWTPEAAFNVYQATCNYLNQEYDFNIESQYYDIDFMEKSFYPQSFLGAEGRRVGKYYAGLDDFELLYPGYETDFTLSVPSKGIVRSGTFFEAILDEQQILGHYAFDSNAYYKYLGGDYPLIYVNNHTEKNGKKIIVVKDSFGIPFSSFLSLACEELCIVDTRYSEDTLETVIESFQPDVVIFCYGPGYLGWPGIVSLSQIN